MIKNSSSLRQLLDASALELVPQKQAEQELSDPSVRSALASAYEKIGYKNREIMRMRGQGEDIASDNLVPVHQQLDAAVAGGVPQAFATEFEEDILDAEPESDESTVAVRVQHLVEALASLPRQGHRNRRAHLRTKHQQGARDSRAHAERQRTHSPRGDSQLSFSNLSVEQGYSRHDQEQFLSTSTAGCLSS